MMRYLPLVFVTLLLAAACSSAPAATPTTAPDLPATVQDAVQDALPTATPTPTPERPVSLSRIRTEFGEPLSSGLSLPDMVEHALRSVVEIRTPFGGGTGFIVNSDGLVVTNKHVVQGVDQANLRVVGGNSHTARIIGGHDSLDLAYLLIESSDQFTPIAVGDSDAVRVGESVVVIGFPIASVLGSEPTVSQGIVSARRADGLLQTDDPVNPGNSGGPMLDQFGNVIGVIVSRVEAVGGQDISGIGFAIPVNAVKADLGGQVSTEGEVLATPTPFPTIGPTPDIARARATLEAIDAQKRLEEQATRTAIEAEQEAARYAASLEATRIAEIPTPTPRPTSTPTPIPTPTLTPTPEPTATPTATATPNPSTYCREWEAMVLDWIREGNEYTFVTRGRGEVPNHPSLTAEQADRLCITAFPIGVLGGGEWWAEVGTGEGQLLPGTYQYRADTGDDRVNSRPCSLQVNIHTGDQKTIDLTYGEPFEFTFHTYHDWVQLTCNNGPGRSGTLVRVGD